MEPIRAFNSKQKDGTLDFEILNANTSTTQQPAQTNTNDDGRPTNCTLSSSSLEEALAPSSAIRGALVADISGALFRPRPSGKSPTTTRKSWELHKPARRLVFT